jgi:hypothetical protein
LSLVSLCTQTLFHQRLRNVCLARLIDRCAATGDSGRGFGWSIFETLLLLQF